MVMGGARMGGRTRKKKDHTARRDSDDKTESPGPEGVASEQWDVNADDQDDMQYEGELCTCNDDDCFYHHPWSECVCTLLEWYCLNGRRTVSDRAQQGFGSV